MAGVEDRLHGRQTVVLDDEVPEGPIPNDGVQGEEAQEAPVLLQAAEEKKEEAQLRKPAPQEEEAELRKTPAPSSLQIDNVSFRLLLGIKGIP